jgi:hypothetical protein
MLLPQTGVSRIYKVPKALIEIKEINKLGETKNIKFEIEITNKSQKEALDLIKQQVTQR